jgi:hypothetical protein
LKSRIDLQKWLVGASIRAYASTLFLVDLIGSLAYATNPSSLPPRKNIAEHENVDHADEIGSSPGTHVFPLLPITAGPIGFQHHNLLTPEAPVGAIDFVELFEHVGPRSITFTLSQPHGTASTVDSTETKEFVPF